MDGSVGCVNVVVVVVVVFFQGKYEKKKKKKKENNDCFYFMLQNDVVSIVNFNVHTDRQTVKSIISQTALPCPVLVLVHAFVERGGLLQWILCYPIESIHL